MTVVYIFLIVSFALICVFARVAIHVYAETQGRLF